MAELIEKILLISLGLSLILLISPQLNLVFNIIQNQNNTENDSIHTDMKKLNDSIELYMNSDNNSMNTVDFLFSGDITVIIRNITNNSVVLLFRFAHSTLDRTKNNIIYQKLERNNNICPINVQINNTIIHSYQIFKKDNSIFITFY